MKRKECIRSYGNGIFWDFWDFLVFFLVFFCFVFFLGGGGFFFFFFFVFFCFFLGGGFFKKRTGFFTVIFPDGQKVGPLNSIKHSFKRFISGLKAYFIWRDLSLRNICLTMK